ncbi:MAG: polysaccharide deacetylase [Actinomycetota bacterium]|nr:polysaccharide deacetylase [Actinomycetota bacterium]
MTTPSAQHPAWPGGAAVAVSLTFDVDAESGWIGDDEGYRRRLSTLSEGRFGITRGVPRLLGLLDRFGIPGSFFVPGYTAELYPEAVRDIASAGHEIGHHGYLHKRNDTCTGEELRDEIERGLSALLDCGVPRPRGYRSPAWEMTSETFDLLVEFDFLYDSSCMGDDRPYVERWEGGHILELPVHWSLDDWPRFGWSIDSGGNVADAGELFSSWAEEYRSARAEGRHVSYTMHPEVIGRAYRLAALERLIEHIAGDGDVWFASLEQVAEHVGQHVLGTAAR